MIFLVARLAGASATYKLYSIPGITGPPEHGLYLKFKKSIRLELYEMQSQNIHVVKPLYPQLRSNAAFIRMNIK